MTTELSDLLGGVRERAEQAGVFGPIRVTEILEAEADASAEPAWYRVEREADTYWVSLVMKDRWLSESIEAELMHTGDKIEELLDEELVDVGFDFGPLPVEHFRSEDMYFTFRSPLPASDATPDSIALCLLAYEACFSQLGDMSPGEDD